MSIPNFAGRLLNALPWGVSVYSCIRIGSYLFNPRPYFWWVSVVDGLVIAYLWYRDKQHMTTMERALHNDVSATVNTILSIAAEGGTQEAFLRAFAQVEGLIFLSLHMGDKELTERLTKVGGQLAACVLDDHEREMTVLFYGRNRNDER